MIRRFTIENITSYSKSKQQNNAELKDALTKILKELRNTRTESNSKRTEWKNLVMTSLEEVSSAITENMISFFKHQGKLNKESHCFYVFVDKLLEYYSSKIDIQNVNQF